MKIDKFTIALHCGSHPEVVKKQIEILKPLEEKYEVHWNNRIDRYPKAYPSYSQLINHTVVTSPTEYMIMINDRTTPSVEKTEKMIQQMESGIACTLLYNVGYMGFAKELVRTIGWWDEGYLLGGFEDRDFIYRMCEADLCIYESQEVPYSYTWKSPLQVIGHGCRLSEPHWNEKWDNQFNDRIIRKLPEPKYPHWENFIGESIPEIRNSWKKWGDSILDIGFDGPNSGCSTSSMIKRRKIVSSSNG